MINNKFKKIKLLAMLLLITLIVIGCSSKDNRNTYTTNAIVQKYCNIFVFSDSLHTIKPNSMPKEFEVNWLEVKITYRYTGNIFSCGYGDNVPVINLIKIEKHEIYDNIYTENAIVRWIPPLDNCGAYMILVPIEDMMYHKYYKPDNLPKEFEVDSLEVKVAYRYSVGRHGCGFGGLVPIINIINIEKQ